MAPIEARTPLPITRKFRRDGSGVVDLAREGRAAIGDVVEFRTGARFWHTRHMIILPPKSSATS
jgi:hypothetical protein